MGAIKREMNNWKWTLGAIGYMCGLAYVVSFIVYQIGSLFVGGGFGIGTVIAILALSPSSTCWCAGTPMTRSTCTPSARCAPPETESGAVPALSSRERRCVTARDKPPSCVPQGRVPPRKLGGDK